MILRPPVSSDLAALVALGRQSFTDAFGHLYAPADLALFLDSARAPDKVARDIADPSVGVMLAEENSALAGYCTIYFGQGFTERPSPQPHRPALLSQLYCAGFATGRGVGAALIEWAVDAARTRDCDAVQLSVWSGNFGAQRFYARHGFAKVADIDFWVGTHRDDEFLYELTL